MLYIGEGFEGSGGNAAHINLLLGPKDGPLGSAFATAAASPGPGHIPFQVVLRPNLPVKPTTLFIGKAVLRNPQHELLTWGPAQAGVAAGITRAVLDGVLPAGAEDDWLGIALVWVDWNADDADTVYANNMAASLAAVKRALMPGWPTRAELAQGLEAIANPFYSPSKHECAPDTHE
jgi:5,6,7,8-tetrahydromethanopterin hydro-lyase